VGDLDFDAILSIQLTVGVLSHNVPNSMCLGFVIRFNAIPTVSTSAANSIRISQRTVRGVFGDHLCRDVRWECLPPYNWRYVVDEREPNASCSLCRCILVPCILRHVRYQFTDVGWPGAEEAQERDHVQECSSDLRMDSKADDLWASAHGII